jgi:hypothetical protein
MGKKSFGQYDPIFSLSSLPMFLQIFLEKLEHKFYFDFLKTFQKIFFTQLKLQKQQFFFHQKIFLFSKRKKNQN